MTLIIGMIVGEYSGDKIGAYLINSILKKKIKYKSNRYFRTRNTKIRI